MEKPVVTINLSEYNELLEDRKKFKEGLKVYIIKSFKRYIIDDVLITNDEAIKLVAKRIDELNNSKIDLEIKITEINLKIYAYNSKSKIYKIFHNLKIN